MRSFLVQSLIRALVLFLVFACKKEPPQFKKEQPEATKITYHFDTTHAKPGDLVMIKASTAISKDFGAGYLSGEKVTLVKIDSFHYAFFIPVLTPGQHFLDVKELNAENKPSITISDYIRISKPGEGISTAISDYKNLLDSLAKTYSRDIFSETDERLMNQLISQIEVNINSITANEKLLLAYQMQNIEAGLTTLMFNISMSKIETFRNIKSEVPELTVLNQYLFNSGNVSTFPSSRIMELYSENFDEQDALLVSRVMEAIKSRIEAIAKIQPFITSLFILAAAPSKITFAASGLLFLNFFLHAKITANAHSDVLNTTGIVEGDLVEAEGKGTAANKIVAFAGKRFFESILATFRSLRKADETSNLNENFADLIKGEYELAKKDGDVKNIFDNIRGKLSIFFDHIDATYNIYSPKIQEKAKEVLSSLNSRGITVSNVSNPNINVTIAENGGSGGISLYIDNPSNTITEKTDFTFQLTYKQQAINKTATIIQHATFVPVEKLKVTTTPPGEITARSARVGGIITNTDGHPILAKGIAFSKNADLIPATVVNAGQGENTFLVTLSGLNAGTKYYARAYATNSQTTFYGDIINFATKDIMPPELSTTDVSSITSTSAVSGGNITNDGGASIISRGVCWSTSPAPTIANNKTTDGPGTGLYTSNITGLEANKTYYIRAYATNSKGTGYGSEMTFKTIKNISIIVGKWRAINMLFNESRYYPIDDNIPDFYQSTETHLQLNTDGTMVEHLDVAYNIGTWNVTNNRLYLSTVRLRPEGFKIETLTDKYLELSIVDDDGVTYFYYKRQ